MTRFEEGDEDPAGSGCWFQDGPADTGEQARVVQDVCERATEGLVEVVHLAGQRAVLPAHVSGLPLSRHTWPAKAIKAIAAPRSTSHSVVNAIVFICDLSCFTFAMFTVRSILLILSVLGCRFTRLRAGSNGCRYLFAVGCLAGWSLRR